MKAGGRRLQVLCFDFDGVIVDSAALKVDAFLALYHGRSAADLEAIRRYCEYHGGVSRQRKIEHIQNNILGEPLSEDARNALAEKFRSLVLESVITAPEIPGARDFLEAHAREFACFVVSGTPHDEINAICQARGFAPYFRAVGGSPTEKAAWIRRFVSESGATAAAAVMIGDAPTDFDAAAEVGAAFVGVGKRGESLLPEEEPLIQDLSSLMERIRDIEARDSR